jgi:uncharacterized membrane protein
MKWLGTHLRNKLLAGLLAAIPIAIVVYIFATIESYTQPWLEPVLGVRIPGLPILVFLVIIYLLGVVVTSILGSIFLSLLDRLLQRIPGFKTLYGAWKDVVLLPPGKAGTFSQVVLVSYPDEKTSWIGFTSGEPVPGHPESLAVFLPNVPNPLTGKMVLMARDRCVPLKVSVGEIFKFFLSTGNHLPAAHPAGADALRSPIPTTEGTHP